MVAAVHVIVGSTGAGKSTFARQLARTVGGVRFAIDEWMDALFTPDRPEQAGYEWYAPRIERCSQQIWATVVQLAAVNTSSVLEVGLTERAARAEFYARAAAAQVNVRLYVVDAPVEVRWQRVQHRNRERGETFSLEVTRGMFDFVEGMWQPPDAQELAQHQGVVIDTHLSPAPPGAG